MRSRLLLLLALGLAGSSAMAASADDILQTVNQNLTPEELEEPGGQTRAKAIADLIKGGGLGLDAEQLTSLKLALAEAWLDALQPDQCIGVVKEVLAGAATPAQRERAGLAFIAAWQIQLAQAPDAKSVPAATTVVAALGDLGPKVSARAQVAEAGHLLMTVDDKGKPLKAAAALLHYDSALALLKDQNASERVPVYHLRLLAMEALGDKPDAVQAWLLARKADPAAAEVADSALTGGEKMVGQAAPAITLKRIDGKGASVTLDQFKGKPLVLFFFATWHQPSRDLAPGLAAFADKHKDLAVLGISLDTTDTVKDIPAWIQATGIDFPVAGDQQGWDGETAASYHVDKIPTLILVGADGTIRAVDLIAPAVETTLQNLAAALLPAKAHAPPPADAASSSDAADPIP